MNELAKKLSEDRNNAILIRSIENDIENELSKPFKKRDFALIDGLMTLLYEIKGIELDSPPIEEIRAKNLEKAAKQKKIAFKRYAVIVGTVIVGIFGLNVFSEKAYGTNALGAFVEIVSGRLSIDYTKKDVFIELPITDNDPYGLREECKKYGIEPLLPSYIPKDFKLTYSEINETTEIILVNFTYKLKKQSIDIIIYQYINELPDSIKSSSDGIYEEMDIDGILMSIIRDDKEHRVTFNYENSIYAINTQNIDYDVLFDVLYSFQ